MALLKFKRSAVPGKVPALADLPLGELALNTYDGKLYIRKDNGTASIVEVGAGAGSGVLSFNSRTGAVTLTSGDVTGALGYIPANKAGDTFSGAITVNSGSHQAVIAADGAIELTRSGGGAYIDFKDSIAEDFDARIQQSGSGFGITGTVSAGSDFRAPIFYDSNDTGYYVDPNTSGISAVFAGDIHINDTTWGTDKALRFREGATDTYGAFIKYTALDNLELGTRNGAASDTRAIYINRGANWAGTDGSFRAPIFYDNNDTGFYADLNGTSNIWRLDAGSGVRVYDNGSVAPDAYGLLSVTRAIGANYAYLGFTRAGNIAISMGIDTNNQFWLGGATSGFSGTRNVWWLLVNGSGDVFASNSFRAPIFYDNNDTGYYTDPAGTSNIWRINANEYRNGATVWRSASSANWISFYFDASGADKFHFGHDGNLWMGLWGDWVSNQWRSNIFYDAADTGYYCDPNGTSYLNTVSLGAQTWRGDITWNTGVNVIVPASAECSFDINSSGVWQVWDLTTSAPMIKCPAGSNVEIGQAGARGLYVYGSIYATGNVTAYSDATVKDNIKPITGALDKVASIGGYTFTRIDLPDTERVYGGVIAQEIETVLPEAVFEKDDKKSVDYNATIALLIEAIKELNIKVKDLEAKLRSE